MVTRITVGLSPGARYHLLLARGGEAQDFQELVAAKGVRAEGGWLATVERPFEISSVEADARLGRWSRKTGGLAVRVSRIEDGRWWLAVHHAGRRSFAMVHDFSPLDLSEHLPPGVDMGRDPLLDLCGGAGSSPDVVRHTVARRRAEQLAAALAAADVGLAPDAVARALSSGAPDGGVSTLLQELGAPLSLLDDVAAAEGMPLPVQQALGKAFLLGCVAPAAVGTAAFVVVSLWAVRTGTPPVFAALLGGAAAFGAAQVLRGLGRRFSGSDGIRQRLTIAWAADPGDADAGPIRPTATALDTWGGFFYLLRDIGFFAGIDRPKGAFGVSIEGWAMGPPPLVAAMNRVSAGERPPDALYEAAGALVALRERLIDSHLRREPVAAAAIAAEVRSILRPVVAGRPTDP